MAHQWYETTNTGSLTYMACMTCDKPVAVMMMDPAKHCCVNKPCGHTAGVKCVVEKVA